MVKFLSMPEYKYSVLVGLLVCIGGVSESLVSIVYQGCLITNHKCDI